MLHKDAFFANLCRHQQYSLLNSKCQQFKNTQCCIKMPFLRIYVATNNSTYLILNVNNLRITQCCIKMPFLRIYVATNNKGLDGARRHPNRTHDLRSGSQDHHPSTNSVQKTICCNLTSSAPDDGRMRPKHVELKKLQ